MNSDGTAVSPLTVHPADDFQPDWQPCNDHMRGGGWIVVGGRRVTFSINTGIALGELEPDGHVQVIDHGTGARLRSTSIEVYEWSGPDSRHVEGTCLLNGVPFPFVLDVADKGEPGRGRDVFRLVVADTTYGPATLGGGNLQLSTTCR
jgi:hypothetical protein